MKHPACSVCLLAKAPLVLLWNGKTTLRACDHRSGSYFQEGFQLLTKPWFGAERAFHPKPAEVVIPEDSITWTPWECPEKDPALEAPIQGV